MATEKKTKVNEMGAADEPNPSSAVAKRPTPAIIDGTPKKKNKGGQKSVMEFYDRRLNPDTYLRDLGENVKAQNMLRDDPEMVYLASAGMGLWLLIWVTGFATKKESTKMDAIYEAIGIFDKGKRKAQTTVEKQFAKEMKVVAVLPKRTSETNDAPIYKFRGKNEPMGKEGVLVLSNKNHRGKSRMIFVEKVVKLFADKGINAQFATDWNQSDPKKQALGDYVTSTSVIRLLQHCWKGPIDKDFMDYFPETRDALFSPPYPHIAQDMMGFPGASNAIEQGKTDTANANIAQCLSNFVDMTDDGDTNDVEKTEIAEENENAKENENTENDEEGQESLDENFETLNALDD